MRYGKLSKLIVVPERAGGEKMDFYDYVEHIMDGEMFDLWMESSEELGQVVMMEDGAGYHQKAANDRREQLEADGWIVWGPGSWLSSSPDPNPIETLWHILCSDIHKRRVQPKNEEQLTQALLEEWEKLDMELVNRLCLSMPRRLQAVIDAEGGITKY